MPRGLDHVVHAVRDLDQAAETYRRLGFTVGARNRHPWGTHNRLVQFPGFFVELLSSGDPEKIDARSPDPPVFSFDAFNREFLTRGEGLSMLALESRNATADAESFLAAWIAAFGVLRFERAGKRPDGTAVKVGFSLAFARDARSPGTGFFVCQQHHPENFWDPAFQIHANTASGIAGVVLVAENPTDHHIFFSAFVGERDLKVTSTGITVPTPRGDIRVMDAAAFRVQFGLEPPDVGRGARLAAIRFSVPDAPAVRAQLARARIEAKEHMGRLVVGPGAVHGATLVFDPPAQAGIRRPGMDEGRRALWRTP